MAMVFRVFRVRVMVSVRVRVIVRVLGFYG